MNAVDTKQDLTIDLTVDESQSFIAGVKAVATSASDDPARPVICNVLVRIKSNVIEIVATNSYMLTVVTLGPYPTMKASTDIEFMVNAKAFAKAMPTGSKNQLTLAIDDDGIAIVGQGTSSLILFDKGGTFPNWENLGDGINVKTNGEGVDFKVNPKLIEILAKQAKVFRGKTEEPIFFKAAERNSKGLEPAMKPIHMTCTVVDRGTWYGLLMPVR